MKTIILILFYLASFAGFFFALSLFGLLWFSYGEVVTNVSWFIIYTIFIGWWISFLPCTEYWKRNQEYFQEYTIFA